MSVRVWARACALLYVCVRACTYICMYDYAGAVCAYTCMCVRVCAYVYANVYAYVCAGRMNVRAVCVR